VTAVEIARATDEVARAVDGVLDLDAGAVGEFATYGTGGRVRGVTVKHGPPARVGLRLVIAYGHPLPELVDDVRSRVTERVAALSDATRVIVDVHIADVTDQIPTAALPAETEAAS
jgi:uncharacterized alkaline shock family protein YloU